MSHTERRIAILRAKADAGDSRAQYDLGLTYYRGDGVPQDMKQARVWLTQAAEQGQRDAQVLLNLEGLRLDQGVQFKLGTPLTKKSAPPPQVEMVTRKNIAVSVPLGGARAGNQATQMALMNDIRQAIEETRRELPENEPLKESILDGLGKMLECLRTGDIPDARTRGMMSLGGVMYRGLEEYGGLDAYKAKIYRIGRAFEDLKVPATKERGAAAQDEGRPRTPRQSAADAEASHAAQSEAGRGDQYETVAKIVDAIEGELRRLGWWSNTPPSAAQMAFTAAFAMDTMPLSMWVQFILLPRVRSILAERGAFPASSMVGAHAVREFDGQEEAVRLVELLGEFDDAVVLSS